MTYVSPLYRLLEFFMGLVLGILIKGKEYNQGKRWVKLAIVTAYLACIYFQLLENLTTFAHLIFIAVTYLYRCPVTNKIFGNGTMQWLAKYSMFFYLGHYPFVTLVKWRFDLSPVLSVSLSLVAVTLMTWGYLFTQRILKKRKGLFLFNNNVIK